METMDNIVQIIVLAVILDSIAGDPQNPFHPVRIMGYGISWGIRLRQYFCIKLPIISFVCGVLLTVTIVLTAYFATKYFIEFLNGIQTWYAYIGEVILCYFIIAPKALRVESMKVYQAIQSDDLTNARKNLSRIVGRDTQHLEYPAIIKATVETVSENFSDGVIAPLFFVYLGGVPLGMAYKAVNTLDSMIGYRNEMYEYFGKFAARLDDIVNFIPARISAFLLIAVIFITKNNPKQAFRIYLRDCYQHTSPNSAHTEAVCAGALGLCLGGDHYYNGKLVSKPKIGEDKIPPSPSQIIIVNRLIYLATILAVVLMILIELGRRYIYV
ncbi:MAG: adenosylcobinamide-phosphate synthase CbiB [Planctomycetaceae bacterium]|jgi:adenosylcobinamide-phosphate synthase|nr:adenosylcobinamide-phosphate synthase CbiB [Planctomycetaceae bacterium]